MDSPIRQYQKQKDYQRHKLFRKIKRRKMALAEQEAEAPIREMRRRVLRRFKDGKDKGISDQLYYSIMERVAENNNNEWNRLRTEKGGRPLSVDEEYLRILNDNSYNYRGYYNKYPNGSGNALGHWTDEFKTVWHPSFSTQSKYSGKVSLYNPYGILGGQWNGDDYVPVWGQKLAPEPKQRGWFEYNNGKNIKRFDDGEDIVYESPDIPINISYVPKSSVRVNPETGAVLTRDNQEGALMLPEVEIRPKRRLEQVYQSQLDLNNPISKKVQQYSNAHYWDPILGAPARWKASVDNGSNPLIALRNMFGIPGSSEEFLGAGGINMAVREGNEVVRRVGLEIDLAENIVPQITHSPTQIAQQPSVPTGTLTVSARFPETRRKTYYRPYVTLQEMSQSDFLRRVDIANAIEENIGPNRRYVDDDIIIKALEKNGVVPTRRNINKFRPTFKERFTGTLDSPKLEIGETLNYYNYHPSRIERSPDDLLYIQIDPTSFWNNHTLEPIGDLMEYLIKNRPNLYNRFVKAGSFPEQGRKLPFFNSAYSIPYFLRRHPDISIDDALSYADNLYNEIYNPYVVKDLREYGLTDDHLRKMIHSGKIEKQIEHIGGGAKDLELYRGSKTGALYAYDDPREAIKKAAKDYNSLLPGQSWALVSDGSLSHDSYTLLLSLMRKHKNDGLVLPIMNSDGTFHMQTLNGMAKRRANVDQLNKAILKINEEFNFNLPMATENSVPSLMFTKYNKGKDPGIHINPKNRGKFNALKKRTGKTTEQLTHSKNPLTRKRAIFALNARKWHHK